MKHTKHKPLFNDDDEPYEFELKPVNGRHIRAFHVCTWCGVLFEVGMHGTCWRPDDSADDD